MQHRGFSLAAEKITEDNREMRPWITSLILAVGLLAGPIAFADQKDPRLGQLFSQLKAAPDVDAAQPIEAEIWGIWGKSGDDNVDNLMAIGIAGLNDADYDQAYQAFSRVVKLAPNFAEGWNKRATTLYLMGRFADSVQDIEKTLTLEPRHFGALSGLGMCNMQLNKDKEALDAFQRALAVDPNMPGVKLNIDEIKKRLSNSSI
jgi:tetratricopeptide (TPR) repeat protein